jgi:hypothetical protein
VSDVRDPTGEERTEWEDLRRQEKDIRDRMKLLEGRPHLLLDERRFQKDLRRKLDTVMAAQREMAMAYWKEAVDG